MKKFIVSIIFGITTGALATPIGYIGDMGVQGQASMVLHNTPCTNEKAMSVVPDAMKPQFFHGEYTFKDGHTIVACWGTDGKTIYIADEEGDKGMLPIQAVKPLTRL